MSSTRELFGGALTTVLPNDVIDASDLRQVPDTQEVFLFNDSDVSIIFEILQIVNDGEAAHDVREAAKFHFASIAHDNAAFKTSIDNVSAPFPLPWNSELHEQINSSSSASTLPSKLVFPILYATLEGIQTVSKFNLPQSQADLVKIFLAIIRVDLGEPSSADPSQRRGADITIAINVPLGKVSEIDLQEGSLSTEVKSVEVKAKEQFHEAVRNFKVADFDLFA